MRRILVCTGVLGGGTALVFALAAATAMLFPQGALVSGGWAEDIYSDMLDDEYSKSMAKNAGFGLSDQLYKQLAQA